MNLYKNTLILLSVLILFGTGCKSLKPQSRSEEPIPLPAHYTLRSSGNQTLDHWWQAFESQELDLLVKKALDDNLDIRSAWARLSQARAELKKTGAGLYPHLNLEGDISKSQTYVDSELQSESRQSSLGFAAGYELDLWSKISSSQEAKKINARAAQEDIQTAALSVAAEVVNTWVDLLAVRQEIDIVKQQISINQDLLDLLTVRFENGLSNALNISQQKEVLIASKSELPDLKARERLNLHKLALLLGQAKLQDLNIKQQKLPELIPLPKTGLPAELLSARPDIRAEFLRLRAADFDLASARADRLPAINITARTALSTNALSDSFSLSLSDWVFNLGSNLAAPVFDAGQRKAEVERSQAVTQERLAKYTQTVLKAIKEVQDALVSEIHQKDKVKSLDKELQAAKQAQNQARLRYLKGLSDYLDFLTELKSVQSLERRIVDSRKKLIEHRVALYRALGGDWTKDLIAGQFDENE